MWVAVIAWTGIGALAALAGLVWLAAVKAQTPRRVPNTEHPPVPFEEVEWKSGGSVIRGWWMPQGAGSVAGPDPAAFDADVSSRMPENVRVPENARLGSSGTYPSASGAEAARSGFSDPMAVHPSASGAEAACSGFSDPMAVHPSASGAEAARSGFSDPMAVHPSASGASSPRLGFSGPTSARPAVVVAHGWGSNRTRMLRYALPLHAAGYSVLVYDARGHGDSGAIRAPNGLQFRDDLISALEWLRRQPGVDGGRIGVLGHSLGGYAGVLALETNAPIAALVTDAMPVRFATMVEAELRRRRLPKHPLRWLIMRIFALRSRIPWKTILRTDPVRVLAENRAGRRIPTLHVHSVRDDFIPHAELRLILDSVPDIAHLLVDTEGHSRSNQDPRFWPTVLAFFREHLGETGVPPEKLQEKMRERSGIGG